MDKNLDEFLGASRRRLPVERHITSRVTTGNIIPEVARATGLSQIQVKRVIYEFLQIVYERLLEHCAVSLRNIGTFYFVKGSARKVAKKQKGTDERKMETIPPRCRLRFRATERLKKKAGWFPMDDLEEEQQNEKERTRRFKHYLEEKGIGA